MANIRGARQGRRPRSVTIRDVARRAGVSTATVSRALAVPEQVAPETRDRVIAAINETGYTPNASAQNLRARSTRMALALVPNLSNTFFTPILNAIEDTLSAAGYGMIIGDIRNDDARESHYVRLVRAGQVDGLMLFTGRIPRDGDRLIETSDVPIMLVCNDIPGETAHSVFDVDDRHAARTAVDYLIAAGHRRIAHLAGPSDNVEAIERRHGYADALAAAGIALDRSLIWSQSFRYAGGVEAAERYLAAAKRPTAVFAAADEAAIGLIKTLRAAGVRTPDDVSVIGFDDLDWASLIDPPLTTMHQPRTELGRAVAEDMLARLASRTTDHAPTRMRLACRLIVRDSVRAAAPQAAGSRARASGETPPTRRVRSGPSGLASGEARSSAPARARRD